jgi:hypothetical protein
MKFKNEVISEIKSYVYIYINPNTKKVFYIGKGQGNRCFDHLEENSESEKAKEINELKKNGQMPIIELLRYGLTDNEASLIESSLIDFVGLDNLTNKVRGLHSKSFGRTSIDDINIKYTADEVTVTENVIAITINKLFYSNIREEELYEATRGVWKIGKRREKAKFVFSVFQGIVREVYEINQWHKSGTLKYKTRDSSKFKEMERWEFEGKIANDNIRNKYIKKSIKSYITHNSQNPIKYINC